MNKSYPKTPPTLCRYVPWLLSQMPNKEASNKTIRNIIWNIYGMKREDRKLIQTGLPKNIHRLRCGVVNVKGGFKILETVEGQREKVYKIGPDGIDLLEGRTPEGLQDLKQSEIDRWKKECLISTGKDLQEIIQNNL